MFMRESLLRSGDLDAGRAAGGGACCSEVAAGDTRARADATEGWRGALVAISARWYSELAVSGGAWWGKSALGAGRVRVRLAKCMVSVGEKKAGKLRRCSSRWTSGDGSTGSCASCGDGVNCESLSSTREGGVTSDMGEMRGCSMRVVASRTMEGRVVARIFARYCALLTRRCTPVFTGGNRGREAGLRVGLNGLCRFVMPMLADGRAGGSGCCGGAGSSPSETWRRLLSRRSPSRFRRFMPPFHQFLTALSLRPGSCRAISAQRFPICATSRSMCSPSS